MIKNTKQLREFLAETMVLIRNGKVAPSDGRNIVGAANQITISMQTELKKQKLDLDMGRKVEAFGSTKL
jgi:hypothetical protein